MECLITAQPVALRVSLSRNPDGQMPRINPRGTLLTEHLGVRATLARNLLSDVLHV